MTVPAAKLSVITIGVRDVPKSGRFYEALGFKRKVRATGDEIVFLDGGGLLLALWDWNKLAMTRWSRPNRDRGLFAA
jgi:catechol 2,3-dioxygenase-like lactoylglutathione lyase family enzyme